ncbi:MAG: HAMP domain-containing histidine kinase [Candidatus Eremiobacteraeota bacterium]|nr:HAMP domain-containing histidine kinase [Candidatus Eremiobacteraeota bacterium]
MRSLRWRIAGLYALLLVAVIVVTGIVVTARFDAILYAQARSRINRTMQDIARVANPVPNPFLDPNAAPPEQTLTSLGALEKWANTTTYMQVDNAHGYPEAKSSNMGAMTFAPNPALSPKADTAFREWTSPQRSQFLIEDRLYGGGGRPFTVHVAEPIDQLNETIVLTRETIGIIIVFASIAVLALSLILAAQATNPLNELAVAMGEIGSDRLDRRLKWTRRSDEIGKLAQTFDDMLARLEDAFARERQFISDASHELKTPLTSINANAQMLRRWGDADERIRTESLDTIVSETSTLAGMVNGMLTLAKADSGDSIPKEPVVLAPLAADAVHSAEGRAGDKNLYVRLHPVARNLMVMGDASLIRQMISNLIDNAIKFTDRGGIDVYLKADTESAMVEVHDTGTGIDADEIPFIFERFYRTDKSRDRSVPGTGLGLAIVRSIARVHNGAVAAERLPAGGTCFRVTFPRIPHSVIENS